MSMPRWSPRLISGPSSSIRCTVRRGWRPSSRERTASMRAWSSTEATCGRSPVRSARAGPCAGDRRSHACQAARGRSSARRRRSRARASADQRDRAPKRPACRSGDAHVVLSSASPSRRMLSGCVEGQMSTPSVISLDPCRTRPRASCSRGPLRLGLAGDRLSS
jgi:hypothetical protein